MPDLTVYLVDYRPLLNPFYQTLRRGDKIIALNGVKVNNPDDLIKVTGKPDEPWIMSIERHLRTDAIKSWRRKRLDIPRPSSKYPSDKYFQFFFYNVFGTDFGMKTKMGGGKVMIMEVTEASYAHTILEPCDQMIDVDGTTITDEAQFKKLIEDGMKGRGWVSCIGLRPMTVEGVKMAK